MCPGVRGDIYISAHFGGAHYHQREGLSDVVDRGREGEREGFRHGTLHKHPVRVITTNDKQIQMMDQNPGE